MSDVQPWHAVAGRVRVLAPTDDAAGLAEFLDATRDVRAEPFAVRARS